MSNYGFYDHNGFNRLDKEVTVFDLPNGKLENTNYIMDTNFEIQPASFYDVYKLRVMIRFGR